MTETELAVDTLNNEEGITMVPLGPAGQTAVVASFNSIPVLTQPITTTTSDVVIDRNLG
jgi:hypothetical protein